MDDDGTADVVAPTAGLTRLIDLLEPDLQLPNDDQLSAWNGASRLPLSGSPQAVSDLAFFVAPAVADLDGDGISESIAANSTYTVSAFDGAGSAPVGWPKLTGGWAVGTPGVGDWDGDGTLEVAVPRRDGVLFVWHTAGTGAASWSAWGCDPTHSGACVTAAEEPPPPPSSTTTSAAPTTSGAPVADEEAVTTTVGITSDHRREHRAARVDRHRLRRARPGAQPSATPTMIGLQTQASWPSSRPPRSTAPTPVPDRRRSMARW